MSTLTSAATPRTAHAVHDDWQRLALEPASGVAFDPDSLSLQPEAVRRWLGRALTAGVQLGGPVQLHMHGELRVGGHWRPFEADQLLAPTAGYICAAAARFGALPVAGFDRYTCGTAEMRWKILGVVPVVTATGADLIRSAAGRLVAEIVLAPTSFAVATWEATDDADIARGTVSFPHGAERVDVRVGADGDVTRASMQRWGNPGNGPFARHPFGADLSDGETFSGLRIPTTMRAGWGWGTDGWESGEFFRATITDAVLLHGTGTP